MTTTNDTLRTMTAHTSVRAYTGEPVSEADRKAVMEAARSASSSCFLQQVSIVRVTDPAKRAAFAELSGGQRHVVTAPEFWVFCADLARNKALVPDAATGWTEELVAATLDLGIMAQSAMTALESLGLGGVFVGGIRNGIEKADELLELPQDVVPLLGLAFGHPAAKNGVKPRLPLSILFSEDRYQPAAEAVLADYDRAMHDYYSNRPHGAKDVTWSETLRPVLKREQRPFMQKYLQKKGWALK